METQGSLSWGPKMIVALIEALVVVGVVAMIVYATYAALSGMGRSARGIATVGGRWEATHYEVSRSTKVVVRKTVPGTGTVLDEHVVAVIPDDDPQYDEKFLDAMAQARSRAALFDSED